MDIDHLETLSMLYTSGLRIEVAKRNTSINLSQTFTFCHLATNANNGFTTSICHLGKNPAALTNYEQSITGMTDGIYSPLHAQASAIK